MSPFQIFLPIQHHSHGPTTFKWPVLQHLLVRDAARLSSGMGEIAVSAPSWARGHKGVKRATKTLLHASPSYYPNI